MHQFQRLIEQARERAAPDAERAALLRRALRLWRGTPLAESVVGILMRSLHATGRTAEALACYRRIQSRLLEQLGVEAGAELRELHQAILRGTVASPRPAVRQVAAPAAAPAPEPRSPAAAPVHPYRSRRPAQLPHDVSGFAGRGAEIGRLDHLLADARRQSTAMFTALLYGEAGIGKTALAMHWAHRVTPHFPDGQLFADLHGDSGSRAPDPADVLRNFLLALGVPARDVPADLAAAAAVYRSRLAGLRVLVVPDAARSVRQVRHLLPGSPRCLTLVTSRTYLPALVALAAAQPIPVLPLSTLDARAMLAYRLGRDPASGDTGAFDEILACCGGSPRALAVAAARVAARPDRSPAT